MHFASRKLPIGGITLNVIVEGEGPDVLLVHGFPDDHAVWRHQIPALVAAGFRVIAPDMRGCGESDAPVGVRHYAIERLVADLVAVLDALDVVKVRLVAHDWGAVIAWQFAIRRPDRVDRYVALSVGHPTAYARGPLEQKLKGWYVLFLQWRGVSEWLLRARGWRMFRWLTRQHPEAERWIANLSRPGRLTAAINYYRANLGLVVPKAFPKLPLRVLGVWSDGDAFLSEAQMRDSQRYVSGPWRYVRVDGASHWLQLDAPDIVNRLLLDELR